MATDTALDLFQNILEASAAVIVMRAGRERRLSIGILREEEEQARVRSSRGHGWRGGGRERWRDEVMKGGEEAMGAIETSNVKRWSTKVIKEEEGRQWRRGHSLWLRGESRGPHSVAIELMHHLQNLFWVSLSDDVVEGASSLSMSLALWVSVERGGGGISGEKHLEESRW
jgi:hypothetical protein